ncbi:MAG: hypothetical protein ACE5DN_02305 [Flavobacteriales bacterium]
MKANRLIPALILPCQLALPALAQEVKTVDKAAIIEERIELLSEQNEAEEADYNTLFDELSYYYDHPVNLNNTDREELRALFLLSDIQIENLLNHIKENGKLISVYELQTIDAFDVSSILTIKPFIRLGSVEEKPHVGLRDMWKNGSNEVFLRHIRVLEDKEGYQPLDDSVLAANPDKRYAGSPDRLYLRYRYRFGTHVSWGFTAEKDAGEEFFAGTQQSGFDYYSAHFFLKNIGRIKQLAIGDFQLQLGQGLTMWSGMAFGKSSEAVSVKKNPALIKPYTSVDENRFLRGVASSVKTGDFTWTAFFSSKQIDANLNTDSLTTSPSGISFTSLQNSGYHRTPAELADKRAVGELIYGGHLAWEKGGLSLGATAVGSEWDAQWQKNVQLYNQFEFNENTLLNLGLDYNYIFRNINIFGEAARSDNNGMAFVNGAMVALDPKFSLAILYRNYQRDYQSLYSNGFAESSKTANEQGIYVGAEATPIKHITCSAYIDRFRFPWLKYQVNAPSDGLDFMLQAGWRPSRKLKIYLRYRQEDKTRNSSDDSLPIDIPEETDMKSLRLNTVCQLNDDWRIRSRVEVKRYTRGSEPADDGFLAFQDVMYKPLDRRWSFTCRYALFQTSSYDARIYAYENDILYYYSVPAYYYRGSRGYFIFKYRLARGIDLWLRYARTLYTDRNEIGSGLEKIENNHKSEIKTQLRIRF